MQQVQRHRAPISTGSGLSLRPSRMPSPTGESEMARSPQAMPTSQVAFLRNGLVKLVGPTESL